MARLVAVGALFGLVLLVRPVSAVIAPFLLILWWGRGAKGALWRLGVVLATAVVVLVPWSIRSTAVMDEPVALSLNFGDNLCLGHNPGATGGFGDLGAHCYTAEGLRRPESETRRNSENIDRAADLHPREPGRDAAAHAVQAALHAAERLGRAAGGRGLRGPAPVLRLDPGPAAGDGDGLLRRRGRGRHRRGRGPPAAAAPRPRPVPRGGRARPAHLAAGDVRRPPVQDAALPDARRLRGGRARGPVGGAGRRRGRRRSGEPRASRTRPAPGPPRWGSRRPSRRRRAPDAQAVARAGAGGRSTLRPAACGAGSGRRAPCPWRHRRPRPRPWGRRPLRGTPLRR